jgi:hypothetical protein
VAYMTTGDHQGLQVTVWKVGRDNTTWTPICHSEKQLVDQPRHLHLLSQLGQAPLLYTDQSLRLVTPSSHM